MTCKLLKNPLIQIALCSCLHERGQPSIALQHYTAIINSRQAARLRRQAFDGGPVHGAVLQPCRAVRREVAAPELGEERVVVAAGGAQRAAAFDLSAACSGWLYGLTVAEGLIATGLGAREYWFPEVRSLGGAVLMLSFVLYPYVYLLARTALAERAGHLMEAARLLGAPLRRRIRRVALPLARPAVTAGVALALMETLADFGVSSYFGIQTFTTGIYRTWLGMMEPAAGAQSSIAQCLWGGRL